MLATSGAFYAFVPKSPSLLSSLLYGGKSEQAVSDKLDTVYKRYSASYEQARDGRPGDQAALALPSTQSSNPAAAQNVQKYVLNGGGIAVQPGLQKITDCFVKVTPYTCHEKDLLLVFFGALSNLNDLLKRKEFKVKQQALGAGTGALTSQAVLALYKHFKGGQELIMLSEMQGQYAFVVYDNHKRQAFAARDATGTEPLFYRIDEDGGVSFTNTLEALPEAERGPKGSWLELPPGHYMVGKELSQFALTPVQLRNRERTESLDADALHMMLRREDEEAAKAEEAGGLFVSPMRSMIRNMSSKTSSADGTDPGAGGGA